MSTPRRSSTGAWLRGGSGVGAMARDRDGTSGGSVVGRTENGAVRSCVILAGPPCPSGIVGVDTHDPPCREIIPPAHPWQLWALARVRETRRVHPCSLQSAVSTTGALGLWLAC